MAFRSSSCDSDDRLTELFEAVGDTDHDRRPDRAAQRAEHGELVRIGVQFTCLPVAYCWAGVSARRL